MTTLHVALLEKFIPPVIELINENITDKGQEFFIYGNKDRFPFREQDNVYYSKNESSKFSTGLLRYLRLCIKMHGKEKVILHGLFDPWLVLLLVLTPWRLKRCYWIIWGGDLYRNENRRRKKIEIFRRFVIKRIGFLVTYTPGDVQLAREWYSARGEHIVCFNYTSNIFDGKPIESSSKNDINHLTIQVGNSGDPSNRHLDIFDKILKELKPGTYNLYIPLAYGDKSYIEDIKARAKLKFGDSALVQTEMLAIEEYKRIQSDIDIAIFAHRRQQAFGNIVNLLGMGKTVYIDNKSTLNQVLKDREIKVYSFTDDVIKLQPDEVSVENSQRISEHLSKEQLIKSFKQWIM